MTIQDAHIAINLAFDKIASRERNDFLPEEIDFYLTKAIRRFVLEAYIKSPTWDEYIRPLLVQQTLEGADIDFDGYVYKINEPVDIFKLVSSYIFTDTGRRYSKQVSFEEFSFHIPTVDNLPYYRDVVSTFAEGQIWYCTIYEEVINTIEVNYIKDHPRVSITSNPKIDPLLPDAAMDMVIDVVVNEMMGDITRNNVLADRSQ